MGFRAKVVLDSIGPNGKRLISVEATYPRFIHSEIMTHRDRARNAASSRAIPWKRADKSGKLVANCMYSMIMTEPVVPISFGREQMGMQSGDELTGEDRKLAEQIWLAARDNAVYSADQLARLDVHKSICNRLTEPFMWITVLMTATEWKNFFRLRIHKDAEKHFQLIASMIRDAIQESEPTVRKAGQWHLPYTDMNDVIEVTQRKLHLDDPNAIQKVSAARCARLSYLTHDGVRDIDKDVALGDRLINRTDDVIHASALEHVACASDDPELRSGPFHGWFQFRKMFKNENVPG